MQPFLEVNHDEDCLEHDGDARWPFHGFFEQLILDLFDPGKPFYFPSLSLFFFVILFLLGFGGWL